MDNQTIELNFEECKIQISNMMQRIHVLEVELNALKHPKRYGLYGQEID
jgi:hypothetical protein